jgi:hypothetical protein
VLKSLLIFPQAISEIADHLSAPRLFPWFPPAEFGRSRGFPPWHGSGHLAFVSAFLCAYGHLRHFGHFQSDRRFPWCPNLLFPSSLPLPSLVLARTNMLLVETVLSLLLCTSVANALRNDRQLRHRLKTNTGRGPIRRRSHEDVALTVEVVYRCVSLLILLIADDISDPLQLKIDHFGNGSGTFKNRYWINDTYYDGGPVFGAWRAALTGTSLDSLFRQSSTKGRLTPRMTIIGLFGCVSRTIYPNVSLPLL